MDQIISMTRFGLKESLDPLESLSVNTWIDWYHSLSPGPLSTLHLERLDSLARSTRFVEVFFACS